MLPRFPASCPQEPRSCKTCLNVMVRATTAPQSQTFCCPQRRSFYCSQWIQWSWDLALLSPQSLVSVGVASFTMGSGWIVSSVRQPAAQVTLVIKAVRGWVFTTFLLLAGTQPHSIFAICCWRQNQSLHPPSLTAFPSGPEGADPLFYLKTSSWRCGLRKKSIPFLRGIYFPLHISSQPDLFKHQKYLCKYIQRG